MENNYSRLLKNYNFKRSDCIMLKEIEPLAKANIDTFIKIFYERIMQFEHAGTFLSDKAIIERHKRKISIWYLGLFKGRYSSKYFKKLTIISQTHLHIGLPPHYLNVALNVVRTFMHDLLIKNNRLDAIECIDKIIDMNLDLLSGVYNNLKDSQILNSVELIHYALKDEASGVIVYTQPIVEAYSLKPKLYECLMRLKDKNGRIFAPFDFLDVSKHIGLYDKLSLAMIEKCFNHFKKSDKSFSINLSFEDINNPDITEYILYQIRKLKKPKRVIFEIVETENLQDMESLQNFLNSIKLVGANIAIDDFGSGFSNFDNIIKLNPDHLKIDGSLIKSIHNNPKHEAIVENIVNLAKKLGIKTVAEFVHNEAILRKVRILGVDFVQGYLIEEPKEYVHS